jgi:glycosyltransferase domain-containing protein
MSKLSKLTLVMPTYNRQSYALRGMSYWSNRGVTLYVLDGSPEAISEQKLTSFADNIHYYHMSVSLYKRLEFSMGLVVTEYSALISDDEFFIPSSLEACIQELDSQSELVSCIGRTMQIFKSASGVFGMAQYLEMENYSVFQDDAVERMVGHMSSYTCSTIYSVVRTTVWKRSISIITQKEFPAFAIGELQFELAVCYQGKSRVIPELMWIRSWETMPTRGTDISLVVENAFENWWCDPGKSDQHAELLSIMGIALANGMDDELYVAEGVKAALDAYVDWLQPKTYIQRLKKNKAKYLNPVLISNIKKLLAIFKRPRRLSETRILDVAKELADSGVGVNYNELSEIESIVTAFHSN